MKSKIFEIKIYTLSDFRKWFWDKICYPRRKQVQEWLDYHNHMIKDDILDVVYDNYVNGSNLEERERFAKTANQISDIIKKQEKETIRLIMLK